jgi:DNA-binding MarR family transcriptional regulator
MAKITASNAANQSFIPLMDGLVQAHHAFAAFDADGHRLSGSGLTVAQAHVIFTLGGTDGMTCREIGDKTLITKGTLTGVIDRLESKGLVERWADANDGRRTIIDLTAKGKRVFQREFPRQIELLKSRFDGLTASERQQAISLLGRIRELFD